jgi:catechol 2,3-dioxygenase-like lactoylglutathione lyase family enzyme
MIHHVSVGTNDIKRARAFYEPLMSHIGFRLLKESDKAIQFGSSDIMFSLETPINGLPATPGLRPEDGRRTSSIFEVIVPVDDTKDTAQRMPRRPGPNASGHGKRKGVTCSCSSITIKRAPHPSIPSN